MTAKPQTTHYRNRIVKYDVQPADQFTAHPSNPKFHPAFQREVIKGILGQVGWVDAVKVSAKTGYTLDGHERIWTALEQGDSEPIPYLLVDVEPEEEAFILATFDPSGSLAQHDSKILDELLQGVSSDSPAVQQMLAELAEKSGATSLPDTWKEFDESVANDVEYITCPHCGEKFPK